MEPKPFLDGGSVTLSNVTYAVCRTDDSYSTAFGTVRDETETTTVIAEDELDEVDHSLIERDWTRLTFDMDLPFELVGFLAAVATALTDAGVSVFVLSSYSTDHIFVKTDDIDAAVTKLEELGCNVK